MLNYPSFAYYLKRGERKKRGGGKKKEGISRAIFSIYSTQEGRGRKVTSGRRRKEEKTSSCRFSLSQLEWRGREKKKERGRGAISTNSSSIGEKKKRKRNAFEGERRDLPPPEKEIGRE